MAAIKNSIFFTNIIGHLYEISIVEKALLKDYGNILHPVNDIPKNLATPSKSKFVPINEMNVCCSF